MTLRVLLTGDVLRPLDEEFRASQTGNILWLHRLLRRAIGRASGTSPEAMAWSPPPGAAIAFDTPGFYAAAGVTLDIEGWIALFGARELPREAAALMAGAFEGATAVIGFELADVQKHLLSRLGVPWMDLNIHPYRFGPDVLFAVQTNHAGILQALGTHHAGDDVFEPWADLVSATAVKVPLNPPIGEETLVVGQTRVDRALLADSRLLDLSDFAGAFHAAIGDARTVLFKPHPYNADGFGLHAVGLPLRRIRETGENAYVLMAQDSVQRVVGVSSSLIAEARFFGKQGIFLGTPPFRIAPSRDALSFATHASVVDAWLSADFWRDVLAPVMPVTAHDGRRVSLPPNALRNALRQFWGWDEIAFQLPFDLARQRYDERRRG
jgi:hypothetical protein